MKTSQLKLITLVAFSLCLDLGLAYGQNFGLINQKPEQDSQQSPQNQALAAAQAYAKSQGGASNGLQSPQAGGLANGKDASSKYTLGPTDVLNITVQRHPEVSGLFPINMEGKIQYQFVGDVPVSGLTKEQAAALITKYLEKYIINPDVTVVIQEYNSKVVYVVGEVGAPGKIFMRSDTMTVRDALLAANLPQLTASTEHATLFTPSISGHVVQHKVNVYALLYQGDLRQNFTMKPGDTLYLPATLWAKVARFINPVTQPISQAAYTGAAVHGL